MSGNKRESPECYRKHNQVLDSTQKRRKTAVLHNGSFANSYTGEGFGGGEMGVGVGVGGVVYYTVSLRG